MLPQKTSRFFQKFTFYEIDRFSLENIVSSVRPKFLLQKNIEFHQIIKKKKIVH